MRAGIKETSCQQGTGSRAEWQALDEAPYLHNICIVSYHINTVVHGMVTSHPGGGLLRGRRICRHEVPAFQATTRALCFLRYPLPLLLLQAPQLPF